MNHNSYRMFILHLSFANQSIDLTVLSVNINTVNFLTSEAKKNSCANRSIEITSLIFVSKIMFAEKSLLPPSNLHLPAIGQSFRRRIRPPPTPSFTSRAAKAAHIAENVSALKAKYADYNTWLKSSTRPNHEPVLSQELLKHSLCQMGIDCGKAEQLVSKCSWYVYQFEKDLKIDAEQLYYMDKKTTMPEKNKLKKAAILSDNAEHSITTLNSLDQGI